MGGALATGMWSLYGVVQFGITVWFIIFSVLVLQKLDRIIEHLSERKPPGT